MARGVVGLVAFVVAALTHYLAVAWFLLETCAVSDVADRVPAVASPQGLLCDRRQSWLNGLPYVALGAAGHMRRRAAAGPACLRLQDHPRWLKPATVGDDLACPAPAVG